VTARGAARGLRAAALVVVAAVEAAAQPAPAVEPTRDAIPAIIAAFATHDLVALNDAHGDLRAQAFLRDLVRAPGFADAVDDIVVEFGNARYQPLVDRYVRGDDLPPGELQRVWQHVVTPNQVWADAAFFDAVRVVNASRPAAGRLRVLLGDPPIDWDTVRTREAFTPWLAMRDSYPAALIQVEVLARRRKALIVYGQLHFQRRQILSNFDMSDWRMQTLVSLIERATPQRVFTIWGWRHELAGLTPDATSLRLPALLPTRGTPLGAADVTRLSPEWTTARRFAVREGQLAPVPEGEWASLAIADQLDAVLVLGAEPAGEAPVPPQACRAPGFLEERLRRIAVAGVPAFEADRIKAVCGATPR
jgi:hypothetical protein